MPKTLYKRRPAGSLKAATAELVTACGGIARAAELCRVEASMLFRYTDPQHPDRYMPVDVVRCLEAACGAAAVTGFLAAEAGAVLLPLPRAEGRPGPAEQTARLAKEISDVFHQIAHSLADGTVDAREAGAIVAEVDGALTAMAAVRAWAVTIRDGEEES